MKKTIISIAFLAVLCCGAYFAWQWYQAQKMPPITESADEFDKAIYDSLAAVGKEDKLLLAQINAENAANAIRRIKPSVKYHAAFTVERFSGNEVIRTENDVWVSENKYRAEITGDVDKTIICDSQRVKIINSTRGTSKILEQCGDFTYNSQIGVVDMNYFLDNAENELITANYAESVGRTGGNLIYVEFYYPTFDQLEKFYISADYGVVLAAQSFTDDTLTYQLTTNHFTADFSTDETMFDIAD